MAESVTKAFLGQKLAAATRRGLKCPMQGHDEAVRGDHREPVRRLNDVEHFALLSHQEYRKSVPAAVAPR